MKKILLILCLLPMFVVGQNLTGTNIEAISGTTLSDALDARCLESVFGISLGTGLLLDGTALKTALGLQSIAGLTETNGGMLYGSADNTYVWLAAGAEGTLLMGNGAAAPSWLAAGTAGYFLLANGVADPVWTSQPTLTSIEGLTIAAGTIIYGTGADAVAALAAGATTTVLVGGGAAAPVWTTATGTGAPVRATSPTLVTPILGTPTSGTATNVTGLPLTTGVTGTLPVANGGTGVTSSTGTGAVVLSTSPAFTTQITTPKVITSGNNGTANTGVTAVEYGDGYQHTTILTVSQVDALTTADLASIADGYLLYTFPAGAIIINYAYMSMGMTATTEQLGDTPDVGLGTVIATGAVALLNGTATFENIITGQTAVADGTAEIKTALPTAGVPFIIESGDAHTIHFNVADAWADDTSTDLTANIAGTVVIVWSFIN